jgi:flagellar protein FliS
MRQNNPHSYYLRNAVETATPARRVVMLHDGAIRFLGQAITAMRERNFEAQARLIGFAQDIIAYLKSSIDRTVASDLAATLDTVYVPLFDMLTDAVVFDRPDRVERVIEVLRELRESWVEVDQRCQAGKGTGREAREMLAA